MGDVIALDPGLLHPAAALARDGVILRAGRVLVPGKLTKAKLPIGQRCLEVARLCYAQLARWAEEAGAGPTSSRPFRPSAFITEWPQIYRREKSKGDPNDLIPLAGIGMALAAMLGVEVASPVPADWTGRIPKAETGDPWASPRGAKVARRLSAAERAVVQNTHDAIDVTGILLYKLGRYSVERVFPGAT